MPDKPKFWSSNVMELVETLGENIDVVKYTLAIINSEVGKEHWIAIDEFLPLALERTNNINSASRDIASRYYAELLTVGRKPKWLDVTNEITAMSFSVLESLYEIKKHMLSNEYLPAKAHLEIAILKMDNIYNKFHEIPLHAHKEAISLHQDSSQNYRYLSASNARLKGALEDIEMVANRSDKSPPMRNIISIIKSALADIQRVDFAKESKTVSSLSRRF